jgi:mannose/fructose-specific phosphotransferase system component IIA
MIGVLILTHGPFGEDLLKTACGIMHEADKVVALNLSRRLDFQTLRKQVADAIQGLPTTPRCRS